MLTHRTSEQGIALVELVVVVTIALIVLAMAVPTVVTTRRTYRISGDAQDVTASILLAKMRAAAGFSRARLYADITGQTFRVEVWNKSGSGAWGVEGGNYPLQQGVTLGFGALTTAPPNTQTTIAQAPLCLNDSGNTIAATACILFNSRGIPVDSTGAPIGSYALYITDGFAVYATTVSATGLIQMWRSEASSANWQKR